MQSVLYSNATVFDGLGERFEQHSVLVDGEHIVAVEAADKFSGIDAEIVDLSGRSLLPGLIDCHVHMLYAGEGNPGEIVAQMSPSAIAVRGVINAEKTIRGGITTVRDCGGRDYIEFPIRDACNRGDLLGPTMRAAGRMICMTGGHGNRFARVADGVDEVIKAVREQVHVGSDLIKLMATGGVMTPGVDPEDAHYTAEEIAAGIAEGHRFHRTCASHAQGTEGILNAVRGGIDSIEHGIFLDEECILQMLERGTYLVPTLAALENINRNRDSGIPQYVVDKAERIAERHRASFKAFYEAGGRIAMGTDAGTPFNFHGENAAELRYMVEAGARPMDAIVFSTSAAADLMRLPEHGRLVAGARADLLAVNGDPIDDIEQIANPANHHLVTRWGRTIVTH